MIQDNGLLLEISNQRCYWKFFNMCLGFVPWKTTEMNVKQNLNQVLGYFHR